MRSGFPWGTTPPGGDQGEDGLGEIRQGRGRGDLLEGGHLQLRAEGTPRQLVQQQSHPALRRVHLLGESLADPPVEVPLQPGGAQGLAAGQLPGQGGGAGQGIPHPRGALRGGDDEGPSPVQLHPRVLRVQGREGGDPQLLPHGGAQVPAGQAVASRVEGGSRHEQVRPQVLHQGETGGPTRLGTLPVGVVPADHRAHHLRALSQQLSQLRRGPNGLGADQGLQARRFLSPHPRVELVQVAHHPDGHALPLLKSTRSPDG